MPSICLSVAVPPLTIATNNLSEGAPLKEAASGGAECNRAAINLTKTKKVLHPTRKSGQPSPRADNRHSRASKRGLCFCTNNYTCINCRFNKQCSPHSYATNKACTSVGSGESHYSSPQRSGGDLDGEIGSQRRLLYNPNPPRNGYVFNGKASCFSSSAFHSDCHQLPGYLPK